jgi:hypothetical protein
MARSSRLARVPLDVLTLVMLAHQQTGRCDVSQDAPWSHLPAAQAIATDSESNIDAAAHIAPRASYGAAF